MPVYNQGGIIGDTMALLNALKAGTYSTVRVTRYNKHGMDKEVRFTVDIYEDSTKQKLLASIDKVIEDIRVDETVPDRGLNNAPASPAYGDRVTVGPTPVGDFTGFESSDIVEWKEDGMLDGNGDPYDVWEKVDQVLANGIVRDESDSKYYLVTDGDWVELPGWVGPVEWALFFDTSTFEQANKSLIIGIYDYLKTTPEFASTTSA